MYWSNHDQPYISELRCENGDPLDDFDWLPGRSSELLSPRPLMKYCRTSDKWYCAEAINHKNFTITYSCSMNQSITQSHVSSLLSYWKHKDVVKSHLY